MGWKSTDPERNLHEWRAQTACAVPPYLEQSVIIYRVVRTEPPLATRNLLEGKDSGFVDKLPLIARLLLGLIFFVFGLNGFLNFLPPPELPEAASSFFGAMVNTGYLFALLKATETVCGFLLLIGRYVPLALTVLAPIVVNIVAFHLFLAPAPAAMVVPLVVLVLEIYLAYAYRSSFRGVLQGNAQPG